MLFLYESLSVMYESFVLLGFSLVTIPNAFGSSRMTACPPFPYRSALSPKTNSQLGFSLKSFGLNASTVLRSTFEKSKLKTGYLCFRSMNDPVLLSNLKNLFNTLHKKSKVCGAFSFSCALPVPMPFLGITRQSYTFLPVTFIHVLLGVLEDPWI